MKLGEADTPAIRRGLEQLVEELVRELTPMDGQSTRSADEVAGAVFACVLPFLQERDLLCCVDARLMTANEAANVVLDRVQNKVLARQFGVPLASAFRMGLDSHAILVAAFQSDAAMADCSSPSPDE